MAKDIRLAIFDIERSLAHFSNPDHYIPPDSFEFGVCFGLIEALSCLDAADRPDPKDYRRKLEPSGLADAYSDYVVNGSDED